MRILIIEDDPTAARHLQDSLVSEGHDISLAAEGRAGLLSAASGGFDLLIIDRMLPGLDGLALLRTLRGANIQTPALFLTALGGLDDRLDGLRAGGDDYLVKPFALEELLARIAAVTRRNAAPPVATRLQIADLELDRLSRTVWRAGLKIELKPREFELLEYLMLRRGQVITRTMLLEDIWQFRFVPQTAIVESHISRLRGKIDRGHAKALIQTCRGAGYKIDDD